MTEVCEKNQSCPLSPRSLDGEEDGQALTDRQSNYSQVPPKTLVACGDRDSIECQCHKTEYLEDNVQEDRPYSCQFGHHAGI